MIDKSKESIEDRIEKLSDGFERYGEKDTPFLLRGGGEKRAKAEKIHQDRDSHSRRDDEKRNQPVTRDLKKWEENVNTFDFPHVDTIPHEKLEERAEKAFAAAQDAGLVKTIDSNADIEENGKFGRYLSGVKEIELDIEDPPLLACRRGPVLAHEVGHAVYDKLKPDSGIEPGKKIFKTNKERNEAKKIAQRLAGPFHSPDVSGLRDTKKTEAELFACVFASLCLEGEAAIREGPNAVSRVERLLSCDSLGVRFRTLLEA